METACELTPSKVALGKAATGKDMVDRASRSMRSGKQSIWLLGLLIGAAIASGVAARQASASASPAAEGQRKLDTIVANEDSAGPWQDVTISALEANAWFAGPGRRKLPVGVSHLLISSQPGELIGSADVDFDRLAAQARERNPLLGALFSGVHQVQARAHVDSAEAPAAHLTVNYVSIDGQHIPNFLLDIAIAEFVHPRHPDIGRQFAISLPAHVRRAELSTDQVTLHYGAPRSSDSGNVGFGPAR